MALSFPRPLGDFWSALRLVQQEIALETYQSTSGTRGGEVLTAELAEAKWRIDAAVVTMTINEAEIWRARFNGMLMRGSEGTFMACDARRAGPLFDRDGTAIAGHSPTVLGLNGRRGIRFAGLPDSYQISAGDWFSVSYGTNPVRYALMQAAESVTANGAGQTAFIDVTPFVKTGIAAGQAVDFVNARAKMVIRDFNPGQTGILHVTGMSFSAVEAF